MNVDEAIPYFQLTQPVSSEGVALLVIDHDDSRLPPNKQLLRVPAQCASTNEPCNHPDCGSDPSRQSDHQLKSPTAVCRDRRSCQPSRSCSSLPRPISR